MILYRVAKAPDEPFGMLVYLLLGRAGDGVLLGEGWYHFRRGRFVMDTRELLMRTRGYTLTPVREATAWDLAHFPRSVGKRWGLRHNCLSTVTLPLLGG